MENEKSGRFEILIPKGILNNYSARLRKFYENKDNEKLEDLTKIIGLDTGTNIKLTLEKDVGLTKISLSDGGFNLGPYKDRFILQDFCPESEASKACSEIIKGYISLLNKLEYKKIK